MRGIKTRVAVAAAGAVALSAAFMSPASATTIPVGSQWSIDGLKVQCEVVTFQTKTTFFGDRNSDAGTYRLRAGTLTMKWTAGAVGSHYNAKSAAGGGFEGTLLYNGVREHAGMGLGGGFGC